jgi:uncharacterized protein (DUF1697 family)
MTRYVALLRAVNVGGRKVTMKELRDLAEGLGFTNVRTLLASGNLVFEASRTPSKKLEAALETAMEPTFKLKSEVMVCDQKDWAALIKANPFPKEARTKPNYLVVLVFKNKPDPAAINAYMKTYEGPETVKLSGRAAYIFFPDGQGRSRLKLPKSSGPATARNWNTVLKLGEMLTD